MRRCLPNCLPRRERPVIALRLPRGSYAAIALRRPGRNRLMIPMCLRWVNRFGDSLREPGARPAS